MNENQHEKTFKWEMSATSISTQMLISFRLKMISKSITTFSSLQIVYESSQPSWMSSLYEKNLESCLLDMTDHWYTKKLSYLIRIDLQNNNKNVKE